MKKIPVLVLSCLLLACGKSKSGKEITQEICDCSAKANALPVADPTRSQAQADCMNKQTDGWEKVKIMETEEINEYASGNRVANLLKVGNSLEHLFYRIYQALKALGVVHCQVGQDLTIQSNSLFIQLTDEFGIGHSFCAHRSIDTGDP